MRPNITETRNSFDPLRRINEAQVDVRNEDKRTANNDDRRFRRPSGRPIDVTTQKTNQSVSTESTTKRDQTQPNRQKKVMIAGDSVLKHLQGHKMTYAVHLRTKINDNKMIFEFQKQDDRRRNHNKRSRNSSI